MDTRYVREFLVFAEELNYSVAARRLFITRPTLTEHIRELEEELGCPLVEKGHGHVTLSSAGKRFVQTGTHLLDQVQAVIDEYAGFADNLLTVTVAQTNLPWLETILYKARCAVQERYPAKCIDIVTVTGPCSTVDALQDGTNDIVVAGTKSYATDRQSIALPSGVSGLWLRTEEIKLLVTQGNPLFDKARVAAKDLDGATLMLPPDIYHGYVRDGVIERFKECGASIELLTTSFNDHFEYFTYDFNSSVGVVPTSLIPRFGIDKREECRAFSLEDLELRTDFFALFTDEFACSENGSLLIDAMRRLSEESS